MSDALAQIRQQQAEAQLKAKADYLLLADTLAKGEQPPANVLAILSGVGKTADELEAAVRLSRERLSLEPRAAAFKQVMADKAKVEAELKAAEEAAEAKLETLREEIVLRLTPLRKRFDDLQQQEHDSRYAARRLEHLRARPGDGHRGPVTSAVSSGVVIMADGEEK